MECKLHNPGFVTSAELGRRLGVTAQAVGKAIRSGRLRAFDGNGRPVSPDYAGRKWLKANEALDDWRNRRLRVDDQTGDSDLVAARVRSATAQADLLELRLARQRGELISKAEALASGEALGRATQRAHKAIQGWAEELGSAFQLNGLVGLSACLRGKSFELANTIADLILAEAEETCREN